MSRLSYIYLLFALMFYPKLAKGERFNQALAERQINRAHYLAEKTKLNRSLHTLKGFGLTKILSSNTQLPTIPADEILLSFYIKGDKLYRFYRVKEKSVLLKTLNASDQRRLAILIRDELEFGKLLKPMRLWKLLFKGYKDWFSDIPKSIRDRVKHYRISGDGLIRYLPLHALVTRFNKKRPHFLIENALVSYYPLFPNLKPKPEIQNIHFIAPRYHSDHGKSRLEGSRYEEKSIKKQWPINRYKRLNKSAFIRLLTIEKSAIHFAGHGIVDFEKEHVPFLLLEERGNDKSEVRLSDISKIKCKNELVVLASCTTAYDARFRNDKALKVKANFAEILIARGVNHLIAASWNVKDRQSAFQMQLFYQTLKEKNVAEALAKAQRQRIKKLIPPHPRYWAFYAHYQ